MLLLTVVQEDITAKYRAEVLQRKLLYNKVQELRGNIRFVAMVPTRLLTSAAVCSVVCVLTNALNVCTSSQAQPSFWLRP